MSEPMTLEALLRLIQQWQHSQYNGPALNYEADQRDLLAFDVPALRAAAKQHAAQLREEAEDGDAGEGVSSTVLRATADWLQPSGAQEPA